MPRFTLMFSLAAGAVILLWQEGIVPDKYVAGVPPIGVSLVVLAFFSCLAIDILGPWRKRRTAK